MQKIIYIFVVSQLKYGGSFIFSFIFPWKMGPHFFLHLFLYFFWWTPAIITLMFHPILMISMSIVIAILLTLSSYYRGDFVDFAKSRKYENGGPYFCIKYSMYSAYSYHRNTPEYTFSCKQRRNFEHEPKMAVHVFALNLNICNIDLKLTSNGVCEPR